MGRTLSQVMNHKMPSQETMNHQMGHMIRHGLALLNRLAGTGFPGQRDIAQGFGIIRLPGLGHQPCGCDQADIAGAERCERE